VSVDVALVTWRELPELDPDDRPLAATLRARGHRVAIVAWDDPGFDWSKARLVLLRNPWDYYRRLEQFLAWTERVDAVTSLWNPPAVLRWNLHKGYLIELAEAGLPVVPTELVRRGSDFDLAATLARRAWPRGVVKPAVSADSWETVVFDSGDLAAARTMIERRLPERDLLVQPFLESVESDGERCLVFLDGALSHAVRKNPITRGGRWAGLPEGTPVAADDDELEVARRVLAAAPAADLLYARVDLVRDAAGAPRLLELELAEPTLFLADHPAGLERLVAGIERRLAARPPA